MPDPHDTASDTQVPESEHDADFDSGFSAELATEAPKSAAAPAHAGGNADPAATAATPAPEPDANAPRYAQVTEQQLSELLANASAFHEHKAEVRRLIDGANGRLGNLKQIIDQLQSGTQQGRAVELTAEDVADISRHYPDLGQSTLKVLQRVVGKLKGTGVGGAPMFDESRVDQRVMQHLPHAVGSLKNDIRNEIAAEELAESYPNWREIVGPRDSPSEFRLWLKVQPDGYGERILASSHAKTIAGAIARFEESRKQARGKRADRLASAVAPRGVGGHGAGRSDDDDFDAGFNSFKQH